MDDDRFDAWAKTRAAGADRRQVLHGLAATLLAALTGPLALAADVPIAAARSKPAKPAPKKKRKRHGRAHAAATTCGLVGDACDGNGDCCPGSVCRTPTGGGPTRCRCRYRRSECAGKCWVLETSERNCGTCGNRCPAGVACEHGQCDVPSTRKVFIDGRAGWVDTGVTLTAGMTATITATGFVDGNVNCTTGTHQTPPDGFPDADHPMLAPADFLAPGVWAHTLVGRVGNGAPRFIGSGPTSVSGGGRVQLGFNDNVFGDNAGGYTATIALSSGS